jgi:hypothetical protein
MIADNHIAAAAIDPGLLPQPGPHSSRIDDHRQANACSGPRLRLRRLLLSSGRQHAEFVQAAGDIRRHSRDLPDRWTWIGVGIIIACGLLIPFRERRRREQALAGTPA